MARVAGLHKVSHVPALPYSGMQPGKRVWDALCRARTADGGLMERRIVQGEPVASGLCSEVPCVSSR